MSDRESRDPSHPPDSVVNPRVRRTAFWLYLGPIIAFFLIVGVVLIYWVSRPAQAPTAVEFPPVGTAGEQLPGGQDPRPAPGTTREELRQRGVEDPVQNLGDIAADEERHVLGRRTEIRGVDVEEVEGPRTFSIRDRAARVQVLTEGDITLRPGQRVDVEGVVERDAEGRPRIRATRVTVRQ